MAAAFALGDVLVVISSCYLENWFDDLLTLLERY